MPPKLVVSEPTDEIADRSARTTPIRRRHTATRSRSHKEPGRSTSSDWIDVDESPPRSRKSKRRSSRRDERVTRPAVSSQVDYSNAESDFGRFFPRLSQILEVNESPATSRPSTRSSTHRRYRDGSPTRHKRHRSDSQSSYRRPLSHRTGGVQRRRESFVKANSSLLSVLSSLTGTSDRSSGSSSTLTQQSYDQSISCAPSRSSGRARLSIPGSDRSVSSQAYRKTLNVFDYMDTSTVDEGEDGRSVTSSSSSSHYEPSDAGSSEAPGTPSSRSTFPSPTTTRSQSVAELRRKYDPQNIASPTSLRSHSRSPASSIRSSRSHPSMSDVPEADEEDGALPGAPSDISYDAPRRSSSRSSASSRNSSSRRIQQQEESMRQHMAYTQPEAYVEPVYGQHRSCSNASAESERSAYAYHMAMQQYQWPSPPPQEMNGHIAAHDRPPAPDAPDLSQRTLTGYEQIALELTTSQSPVRPLYRKFEYLNHRVLLHLQDELSELEEQLRTVDEIIAQMDPALANGQKTPASRRGDAFHGHEIHLRRTHLLGHIFVKTEQYNKAMSAYSTMAQRATSAEDEHVTAYQQWMSKHTPIHDVEARFLQKVKDLVVPGTPPTASTSVDQPTKHAALAYLPVALMLPLLLFSIIPTLGGRLIVTALIAIGAFVVAAATRIRQVLPGRDWAVCGAIYVLLMGAIAGCISQH